MYEFKKVGRGVKIFETAKIIKPGVIEIGDYSEIDDFTFIYGGRGIKIGKFVHISRFVSIIGGGELHLGDYSVLADGARVMTGTDTYHGGYRMSTVLPPDQRNPKLSLIKIEKDAFVGANSIIHPGITIGEGAIIGSNSLVLKDIEPWTINVGSPTRVIGKRPKVKFEDVKIPEAPVVKSEEKAEKEPKFEKKGDMSLLFLMKPTYWCDVARRFIEENFSNYLIVEGEWGDPIPEFLYEWEGDYIISFLSPWIIPLKILENCKIAAMNFHPAPPEYPGIGCYNFAIYDGVKEYGVTCHIMLEKVDTGSIIAVTRFPIYGSETIVSLKQKTMIYLTDLFYEVMDRLIKGEELPRSDEKWARRPFTRKEFQELCKLRLDMSEDEFSRRLKATYFPGALDYPNIKVGGKVYYFVDPDEFNKEYPKKLEK